MLYSDSRHVGENRRYSMKSSFFKTVAVSSALVLMSCGVEGQAPDEVGQPTADIQSTTSALSGCYPVGTSLKTTRETWFWWRIAFTGFKIPAGCTLRLVESCPPVDYGGPYYKVHDLC